MDTERVRVGDERTAALAARVVALAASQQVRIAVAESLTGGLLAAALVSVPGASRVFSGGVTAYNTDLKRSVLGVDESLLLERGPVDESVAQQMAAGVRSVCAVREHGVSVCADYGLATTGVAGPDPDAQTGQPVGTVWIAVSSSHGGRARLLHGVGESRNDIREATVRAALELLLEELTAAQPAP